MAWTGAGAASASSIAVVVNNCLIRFHLLYDNLRSPILIRLYGLIAGHYRDRRNRVAEETKISGVVTVELRTKANNSSRRARYNKSVGFIFIPSKRRSN